MGLATMNPVGMRMNGMTIPEPNAGSLNAGDLMDMESVSMSPSMHPETTLVVADAGLVAMDTAGVGSEGIGVSTGTGTSDLWSSVKLDKNPDVVGRRFGPGMFIPDLSVIAGYNDNLTFENNNAEETYFTRVTPHVAYVMSDRFRKMALDYFLDAAYFEGTGGEDDYVDNRLVASFDYHPTSRIFTSAFAEYIDSHDGRGKGRAEGGTGTTQTSLDEWYQWGVGGNLAYGAQNAKGRLELDAAYLSKTYDTNRLFTFSRDVNDLSGSARFFYRVMPKTSLLFEARTTAHDYKRDVAGTPSLDGMTTSFFTGVTWQATYKTTGFAKIGYNIRSFDSDRLDTQDDISWGVGVDWRPKSYSTVHLETSQALAETNGTGDVVTQSSILAYWQHNWRDRFSTRVDLGYQNSTMDPSNREDDTYLLGVRADYAFRRWMNVGAGYRYSTVDSTDDTFGYDQNIFLINLDLIF